MQQLDPKLNYTTTLTTDWVESRGLALCGAGTGWDYWTCGGAWPRSSACPGTGLSIGDVIRSVVGASDFVLDDIAQRNLDQLRIPATQIQEDDRHRAKAAEKALEAHAFPAMLGSSYWRGCGDFNVGGHMFSVTTELLNNLR